MHVWVLGPSGAGKPTLTEGLHNLLGCDTVQVGELLRSAYNEEQILNYNIPESEIFSIVSSKVKKGDTNLKIIDGFPTNIIQLNAWENCFSLPELVLVLEASEEILVQRKLHRGRIDDTACISQTRKLRYDFETLPVLQYLSSKNLVQSLNSNASRKEVLEKAFHKIRGKFL